MAAPTRDEILARWSASGRPLTGAPAGRSPADYWVVTNAEAFPDLGPMAAFLPLGDANAAVLQRGRDWAARAGSVPLLAGLCGTDPLRLLDRLLDDVRAAGFAGVQNWPSVGLIDGGFRTSLEETNLGFDREVELIRLARQADLVTVAVAFTPDEASRMAEAGADAVLVHPGLAPEDSARRAAAVAVAARTARRGLRVLFHGAEPVPGFDGLQLP